MATLAAQAAHPIRLDYSAVDYATAFVKEELKPLTARFDETLEKTFMPRIRAVLREVEQERRAYLEAREDRLVVLRQKLHSFGVDKTTADTLLGRICHFPPELLGLLPTESLLGDFVLSRAIAGDGFLAKSPNLSVDSAYAGSPASVEKPNHFLSVVTNVDPRPATYRPEPTDDRRISTRRRSQQQQKTNAPAGPAVDSPTTARSRKRYNDGEIDDAPGPSKRLRNLESEVPSPKGTQGPPFRRALRPADIQPQERIFRHFDREGYFVVRCDRPDCLHRYFTEQPFGYSRAYRHFVKQHNDTGLENSRISDEEIFDRYAHEVLEVETAPKDWLLDHVGSTVYEFIPKSRKTKSGRLRKEDIREERTPDRLRGASQGVDNPSAGEESDDSDEGEEDEERRDSASNPAQEELNGAQSGKVPGQEFARLARRESLGKTLASAKRGNATDRPEAKGPGRLLDTSVEKSRLGDPQRSSRASFCSGAAGWPSPTQHSPFASSVFKPTSMEPSKPFGYFEEWPRRSAPS